LYFVYDFNNKQTFSALRAWNRTWRTSRCQSSKQLEHFWIISLLLFL